MRSILDEFLDMLGKCGEIVTKDGCICAIKTLGKYEVTLTSAVSVKLVAINQTLTEHACPLLNLVAGDF